MGRGAWSIAYNRAGLRGVPKQQNIEVKPQDKRAESPTEYSPGHRPGIKEARLFRPEGAGRKMKKRREAWSMEHGAWSINPPLTIPPSQPLSPSSHLQKSAKKKDTPCGCPFLKNIFSCCLRQTGNFITLIFAGSKFLFNFRESLDGKFNIFNGMHRCRNET